MGKRDWAIFFLAIALTVLGVVRVFVEGSIETGAWGLSFRQEGSAPIGPAGVDQLRQYDAAYLGDTRQKRLYLTFDAGYENGSTEKILDTLKAHGVRAAFFLVGNYVDRNRDLVRRMVEEGHIVGNHTMHHYDMSKLSDKQAFSKELTDLEDLFREVTGKDLPKYYRPPQGIYSQENLKMAKELGYKTVFWSLAYVDWMNDRQPTKEQADAQALKGVEPQLRWEEIDTALIDDARVFHFGTLSLTDEPARTATQKAIAYAKSRGKLISCDPNLRLPLWPSEDAAKAQILWSLRQADVVKISDNEVEFLWGCTPEEGAEKLLAEYGVSLAMVTLGPEGCLLKTRNAVCRVRCPKVHPMDTTGAGDIFGGSAMARLLELEKPIQALTAEDLAYIGSFAAAAASLSTEHSGGIPSIPEKDTVLRSMQDLCPL